MSPLDKLLMFLVPTTGLLAIFMFFSHYNYQLTLENNNNNLKKTSSDITYVEPYKSKKEGFRRITSSIKSKNNNYIKSEQKQLYITNPIRHQKNITSQQNTSHQQYLDAETLFQQDQLRQKREKQAYQNRLRANKERILRKRQIEERNSDYCTYVLKMKKRIKERMNRGYKASEYNYLEKKRKHWADEYSNNCFN